MSDGHIKEKANFNNNRVQQILVAGFLIMGFVFSYQHFVRKAQRINYQVFNLQETISWRETKEGIYRIASKGDYDTIALSSDEWSDFELSFILLNVREAGLIHDYKDNQNFHFIFLNKEKESVVWGFQKNGKTSLIKKTKVSFNPSMPCQFNMKDRTGKLFINQKLALEVDFSKEKEKESRKYSKIGLMLKTADFPPTVFSYVSINGTTSKGDINTADSLYKPRKAQKDFHFWLVLVYTFMLATSVYLADVFDSSYRRLQAGLSHAKDRINFLAVCLIHLGIAIFLFWPFVFRGEILVSSADNFGEIYPLFLLSKHVFTEMFSVQIFENDWQGLWNPYAHNGIPFFSNHWNMLYYPLNWIIFLFKDSQVLSVLTLRVFIEVFLLGIFAYKLFKAELGSSRWALFCSIVYQLCSLLIFNLTIFPSISLFFAMTVFLYVLWTLGSRNTMMNFLLITVSTVFILTSANLAFLFYGGLSLIVFTIYRLISEYQTWNKIRGKLELVFTSVLVGMMISAIRVIPAIVGVMDSNRLVENYYTLHDRIAMVTRLFIPEIVGWLGANSFNALTSPNLNLIYFQANLPSNSQNTFLVYFGVLAGLLILFNLFIRTEGAHTFWKVYSLVAIALGLMFQPFWGVFNVLLFPFNHYSYYIIILPVAVCALLGHTGKYLISEQSQLSQTANRFFVALIGIQFYIIVIVTYLFPEISGRSRLFLVGIIVWYTIYYLLSKHKHESRSTYLAVSTILLVGHLWVSTMLASKVLIIRPFDAKQEVLVMFIIPIMLILCALLLGIWFFRHREQLKTMPIYRFWVICFAVFLPFMIVRVVSGTPFRDIMSLTGPERHYILDVFFGETKFVIIALIGIFLVALYAVKRMSKEMLITCFIVVALLDLMAFNARFDNVVAPTPRNKAFYPKEFPYTDISQGLRKKMDLLNYRANNLHRGGLNANKNLIFKVPSYSGIMGHMPKRFSNLIRSFGYPKETVLIYPSESTSNGRFLDLSAVRYDFIDQSNVKRRSSALPRMSLFYSYEIINDEDKLLERLKSSTFDPKQTVLFEEDPGFGPVFKSAKNSRMVAVLGEGQSTGDSVVGKFKARARAVLLFSESYSKDWRAYVDNERVPIYRANYNFMACLVNPGEHVIEFRYEPRLFFFSKNISIVGVIFFAMSITLTFFFESKEEE